MTTFVKYFIEANVGLLLVLLFYRLVLSSETNFKFLRFFLLTGISFSLLFPLFHFQTAQVTGTNIIPTIQLPEIAIQAGTATSILFGINLWNVLVIGYGAGVVVLLSVFLIRIIELVYVIRSEPAVQLENVSVIESGFYKGTFSFFNYVFIGKADAVNETEKKQIIEHEKVHVQQLHSFDILLVNLLSIVFWINPFIRIFKKVFVQLHEFEADARAVKSHDANMYCSLLARVALQSAGFSLANHFNNSLTVKRITMIRTIKKKISTWKLSMASILFLSMFFLLACQDQVFSQKPTEKSATNSDPVFMVVDEPPTYPGGFEKMPEFFSQNMKYPEKARKENIEGTVYIQFIVEKDGKVGEAEIIKGINKECDEEALRVVKLFDPWIPGKQSGQPVRVKFVVPVKFKL